MLVDFCNAALPWKKSKEMPAVGNCLHINCEFESWQIAKIKKECRKEQFAEMTKDVPEEAAQVPFFRKYGYRILIRKK